jgi:hypothetical protein
MTAAKLVHADVLVEFYVDQVKLVCYQDESYVLERIQNFQLYNILLPLFLYTTSISINQPYIFLSQIT